MQYTEIFLALKIENFQLKKFDIFLIFAQNIDCGYSLEPPLAEAVLTSTHNLCFGAKIRKIGIPLNTPVLLYKSGVGFNGVYITRTCFHDDCHHGLSPLSYFPYSLKMLNGIYWASVRQSPTCTSST